MVLTDVHERLTLHGRLSLIVVDQDGNEVDRRDGSNTMCTTGFTAIAAALVWSGVQDQAATIGVTSPTFLTPLWGAVGSGAGTPAKGDTQLYTELGRQTVGAGAYTPATSLIAADTIWLFYFPSPPSTWTVTEAGVFASATSVVNSGSMMDHQTFAAVTVTTANSLILQASFALGP